MRVFAVADLHLAGARPDKTMAVFGPPWDRHPQALVEAWHDLVRGPDLVVVAGDISWAMTVDEARPDLELIGRLPGRKVLLRGNHDYWWGSAARVRAALPPGVHALHHDAVVLDGVAVGGARLWDDPAVRLGPLRFRPGVDHLRGPEPEPPERTEKILARELARLERSLAALPADARLRLAAVHYPPVGTDLAPSRASAILERAGVGHCVFGHLHGLLPRAEQPLFGERAGVLYHLTSCDYLDMVPLEVADLG